MLVFVLIQILQTKGVRKQLNFNIMVILSEIQTDKP